MRGTHANDSQACIRLAIFDGQSLAAGGLHEPTPEQLERFRQKIDQHSLTFKEITASKDFVELFVAVEGERLKTAPKGYDRNHPAISLLQLKQITIFHHFSDQEVLDPGFSAQLVRVCRAMKPFLQYLEDVI